MNYKLVESYVKDQLRKQYGSRRVFGENGICYIDTLAEINFGCDIMHIYGYKTRTGIYLCYPSKDGYEEKILESIISVITALIQLQSSYVLYREVI